jgi:hypothetical protein
MTERDIAEKLKDEELEGQKFDKLKDDVEGHKVKGGDDDEDDTEGHKVRGEDDDDVEGHKLR